MGNLIGFDIGTTSTGCVLINRSVKLIVSVKKV